MAHPFELTNEFQVDATPEEVWDAIATGPGVDAAKDHIDGVLLLEGGGPGNGSANVSFTLDGGALDPVPRPTSTEAYDALVAELAAPGGPDVFIPSFTGAVVSSLGAAAELAGLDGTFRAGQQSLVLY